MRRLPALLQLLCGSLASLLAALYLLSRLATDRTHVTQYLFWTPWPAYALAIAILLLPAFLLTRRARRRSSSPRRARAWTWRLPAIALSLILLHVLLADWHAWRFLFRPTPAPPERTLRLLHWNMTYADPRHWDRYIAALQKAPRPDVLIVTNPTIKNDLDQLAAGLGPDYRAVRCGIFALVSRLPIFQTGSASLQIPPYPGTATYGPTDEDAQTDYLPDWSPIPRTGSNVYDPGHAMYARLDARASLGREIVIWGIDMPSEPRAWRMNFATAAAQTLRELTGESPSTRALTRFPLPDIIAGDCNTPRGSASLSILARGYTEAFDQAGRGHAGSWPRGFAWFHLDHIFLSPDLRATSYRVLNLGMSEHLAQTADITAR